MTFAPRTIAQFNASLEDGRRSLRDAPQVRFAEPVPELPPPPGSFSALESSLRDAANRDLRSGPRRRVDEAWTKVREFVFTLHGRQLPTEIFDCSDAGEESALQAARLAGEQYAALAAGAGVTRESLDAAYAMFVERLSNLVGRVTSTWPSAADREAVERRRLEDGWR